MSRVIALVLLLPGFGHAITLNHTLINQCSANFINCSNSNCTQNFNGCLAAAEIPVKKPQSCYQAEAASYALSVAAWTSLGLFLGSLLVSNGAILVKYLSNRFGCCICCRDLPNLGSKEAQTELPLDSRIDLLKAMTSKTAATLSTVIAGTFTFVSAGWIFNLWQAWTIKDADCNYYKDQQ